MESLLIDRAEMKVLLEFCARVTGASERIATALEAIASPQPDRLVIAAQMMAALLANPQIYPYGNYSEMRAGNLALAAADALLAAHAEREGK